MQSDKRNNFVMKAVLLWSVCFLTACKAAVWQQDLQSEMTSDLSTQQQENPVDVLAEEIETATDTGTEKVSFQMRTLDLTKGDAEAFQALRRKQLVNYQKQRKIDTAFETEKLPAGLLEISKEALRLVYSYNWNAEKFLAYEDKEHQLTQEQVQTYLGELFSDYYAGGSVECAYLVDWDKNGSEELVLYYRGDSPDGPACVDVWQKREGVTVEQLYSISEMAGYAALLDYANAYYFVVRQHNDFDKETDGLDFFTVDTNGILQQYRLGVENKENRKSWIETYHNREPDDNLEQKLTDYIETVKREVEEKTVSNRDYQLIYGNAETTYQESDEVFSVEEFSHGTFDEQSYRFVDFDNDGKAECVEKKIWYPYSGSQTLCLIDRFFEEDDSGIYEIQVRFPCFSSVNSTYVNSDSFGTPVEFEEAFEKTRVQLWFEKFGEKVYTFNLNRIDFSSDYLLEISLIEGKTLHPLRQYLLIPEKEYTFEQIIED